jgi:hypothetical protein
MCISYTHTKNDPQQRWFNTPVWAMSLVMQVNHAVETVTPDHVGCLNPYERWSQVIWVDYIPTNNVPGHAGLPSHRKNDTTSCGLIMPVRTMTPVIQFVTPYEQWPRVMHVYHSVGKWHQVMWVEHTRTKNDPGHAGLVPADKRVRQTHGRSNKVFAP